MSRRQFFDSNSYYAFRALGKLFVTKGHDRVALTCLDVSRQNSHKNVILRACDFFDLLVFTAYPTSCISTPDKAVILSEALRRFIASRGLYGAESKDPRRYLLTDAPASFQSPGPNLADSPRSFPGAQNKNADPVLWLRGWKARNGMGKINTLGVLRLRAIKPCVTR
jgi:hypothetical protein